MLDHHTLGTAGRAGGVDDIDEILCRDPAGQIFGWLTSNDFPVRVQAHDLAVVLGQASQHSLLGQQHGYLAILEHEGQTVWRIGGIQWDKGASRLEDSQQRHDHLQGALHTDTHQHLRPYFQALQVVGQLIGPGVKLAIRQLFIFKEQRDGIWRALHLSLKELVDTPILGVYC